MTILNALLVLLVTMLVATITTLPYHIVSYSLQEEGGVICNMVVRVEFTRKVI